MNTIQKSAKDISQNHLALFAHATGEFSFVPEDKEYHGRYALNKDNLKVANQFVGQWVFDLESNRSSVLAGGYATLFKNFLKQKNIELVHAESFLAASKKIHKSPFGVMGLSDWPEIRPRTIRDRIYLVLQKKGAPLHFTHIAKEINLAKFDTKIALASTVHNELIKDNRFVLVGRGLYGLKEHGYMEGTCRDVLCSILKNQGPLSLEEIVQKVAEQRFLKHNTILLNLQNKKYFHKNKDGKYDVAK